jgi:hypothetical protein
VLADEAQDLDLLLRVEDHQLDEQPPPGGVLEPFETLLEGAQLAPVLCLAANRTAASP